MLNSTGTNVVAPNTTSGGTPVRIWVVYFGPNGSGGVTEMPANVVTSTTASTFTVAGIFGNRILKAYVIPSTYTAFNSTAVSHQVVSSAPLNIAVVGGGQTVSNLVLPYYNP